jgi:peptide/nickel transport system substrate-binding protein
VLGDITPRGDKGARNWGLRLRVPLLVASLLLAALAGCGSSDEDSGRTVLRGTYNAFPDYLDPALSFTAEGWTAMQNTYLPLLTYAHANGNAGTRLIPGLAKGLPRISEDGLTYTLSLRPGLEYSDGSPVRASDFRSSVERLFLVNSAGSTFYTGIVGAQKFAETRKGGISGIRANDRSGKIVIELTEQSGTFKYVLGLPFASVIPADTPAEDQTASPPPATGPYEITESRPGRGWKYARNPAWEKVNSEAMPQLPSGHVDAIEMEVVSNQTTQVNDVEKGRFEWMKNPPPPELYAQVKNKYDGTQFRSQPTISNFYFWMNTQRPPFDDLRVRRAVNYAISPAALERIYAGSLTATQQVLPPQMPGYDKFVLYPHDMARAKALIAEADPVDRDVTVWTNDSPANDEAGEYYEQVLEELGFHARLKAVATSNYFTLISNQATPELDTGWGNWLLDYPHPNDYFAPQLSGENIAKVSNSNWAMLDNPAINAKIKRLARQQLGPRQTREYAALDREVMKLAPWAPFGNFSFGIFVSDAIDLDKVIFSPIFGQDLTSFEFK